MTTIWKLPIPIEDEFSLQMPGPAEFLSVQEQRGEVFAWFVVDERKAMVAHKFVLKGTGNPFPEWGTHKIFVSFGDQGYQEQNVKHLGTFQLKAGLLVFHLFLDCRKEN